MHLPQLREVWDRPQTDRPVLEPLFAAGCHGIELACLLLSEFVADPRTWVLAGGAGGRAGPSQQHRS